MGEIRGKVRDIERRLFASYGLEATERAVEVEGVRVRLLEIGRGPPVLVLHGISSLAAHWAPLLPYLKAFRCLVLDWPGHGLSGNFDYRGVSLRQHAAALLSSLLDKLALTQVPIVSNSLGTQFTFFLALDRPGSVKAIVTLGSPATAFKGSRPRGILLLMATPGVNRVMLTVPSPRLIYRAAMADVTGWPALRSLPSTLMDVGLFADRLPGHAATVASLMERVNRFRTPRPENVLTDSELVSIANPVLFVWGRRDRYLSPEAGARFLQKMPHAKMEVIEAGHLPWFDQPAVCGRLVSDFLGRL